MENIMNYTVISHENRKDFIYTLNYLECRNRWITDNSVMIEKSKEIIVYQDTDYYISFWSESKKAFVRDFGQTSRKEVNMSEYILNIIDFET